MLHKYNIPLLHLCQCLFLHLHNYVTFSHLIVLHLTHFILYVILISTKDWLKTQDLHLKIYKKEV